MDLHNLYIMETWLKRPTCVEVMKNVKTPNFKPLAFAEPQARSGTSYSWAVGWSQKRCRAFMPSAICDNETFSFLMLQKGGALLQAYPSCQPWGRRTLPTIAVSWWNSLLRYLQIKTLLGKQAEQEEPFRSGHGPLPHEPRSGSKVSCWRSKKVWSAFGNIRQQQSCSVCLRPAGQCWGLSACRFLAFPKLSSVIPRVCNVVETTKLRLSKRTLQSAVGLPTTFQSHHKKLWFQFWV